MPWESIWQVPSQWPTGCGGGSAVGHWEGTCQIDSQGMTYDFDLDFDIDTDEKGEVAGVALFDITGANADFVESNIEGTHKGKDVAFSVDVVQDLVPVSFKVEAELKGDTLDGDCILGVMGLGIRGDLELDRS